MKLKTVTKIIIDILMTVGLLFLSGYQFFIQEAHEWVGAILLVLFIAHHILNIGWYKSLFKGKYSLARIFRLVVDMAILVMMLIQMYSGIAMSAHVFAFLDLDGGMAMVRRLHILGAYWGFVLMSVHIGLHWSMIMGMIAKAKGTKPTDKPTPKAGTVISRLVALAISAYGIYAMVQRGFLTYMFLRTEFVFLDYNEPPVLFYIDYIAIMGLFVALGHYLVKLLRMQDRPSDRPSNRPSSSRKEKIQ